MKQFMNPIAVAIVLISALNRYGVKCLPSSKSGSLSSSSSSGSSGSSDGSQSLKDLKTDSTSFWSPQPEYYHERDRYSGGNRPSDFVTSYGSFENKYGSSPPSSSSLSSSSSLYGNKDRLGGYSPFSTGSSGSYYSPGGVFDRKPYGPSQPTDYPAYGHEYDGGHYDYNHHQGHGFSLGHHGGSGKDITKSILLPLAGAALLGIAAALVANPVLLHLGAFAAGKRKRRDVTANAHNLAYRAHLKPVKPLALPKA